LKKSQVTTTQQGSFAVTVDNILSKITVNGVAVPLSGAVGDWGALKIIKAQIKPGDAIAITGVNQGGPAGIIATITYFNESGNPATLDTNANWKCDGGPAKAQGANGVAPWGKIGTVSATAQWIWNPAFPATTTCTISVPTTVRPATIYTTADNGIDSIYVNGKLATLVSGNPKIWEQLKKYTVVAHQGDEISITATNLGGPDGIIARIVWTAADGSTQETVTNAETWYCDSKSAGSNGFNGTPPWGIVAEIGPKAQWIWNPAHPATTTCKTHLGGSSKKCKK